MNKFFSLLNVELRESFSSNNTRGKKTSFGVIIGLLAFLFIGLSIIYNFTFFMVFKESNSLSSFPLFMAGLVVIITFFTASFRSQLILFSNKDHNILEPMPIKKSMIISTKLILFLLEELIFSIIIYLPTIYLYSFIQSSFIPSGIILMLTLPLLSILIAVIVGFVFNLMAKRFAAFRIIIFILYIIFFILVMGLSLFMNNIDNQGYTDITNNLVKFIPFLSLVKSGFLEGEILSIVLYFVVTILSTLIVVGIYSLFYDSFYQMLQVNRKSQKFTDQKIKSNNPILTLMKKDFKIYFQSPMILINAIVGGIMSIIIVLFLNSSLSQVPNGDEAEIIRIIYLLFPYFLGLFITMSSLTSMGISIEQKNFWIMKVLPINIKDYFMSKLLINQIINGILAFISSIILVLIHQYDVIYIILIILYPQLMILAFGLFGLIINLLFPKLNWTNYNQIKNSSSLMITTFTSMIFNIIMLVISYFTIVIFNGYLTILINVSVPLLLSILFIAILKYKGRKWLNDIEV